MDLDLRGQFQALIGSLEFGWFLQSTRATAPRPRRRARARRLRRFESLESRYLLAFAPEWPWDKFAPAAAESAGLAEALQSPDSGAQIESSSLDLDVKFCEPVFGADASDLVLSGPAVDSATVSKSST